MQVVVQKSIAKYGLKELVIWVDEAEKMPYIDPISFCQRYINFLSEIFDKTFEKLLNEITN